MYQFFAGLRSILADTDIERMNLGSLVQQMIRDDILPKLDAMLLAAKSDEDRARLTSVRNEYVKFSTPGSSEGKAYSRGAAMVIQKNAQISRLSDEEREDLAQEIALDFLQPLKEGGKTLQQVLQRFDPVRGPVELGKMWMHVVDLRSRYKIREMRRKYRETTLSPTESDDGKQIDPFEQMAAPSRIDEGYIQQVMKDLVRYMNRSLRKPEHKALFNRWMDVAQTKGVDRTDMKNDVYPWLVKQGFDVTYQGMSLWWNEVKQAIVRFFDAELEGAVSTQIRRMLKVGSAEVLTYEGYRRALASWILRSVRKAKMIEELSR